MDFLIVVDMQNDFIDGSLGTKEALSIIPAVKEKIKSFNGKVVFTRDTHNSDYLSTQEGENLPVEHCIKDSNGWKIHSELDVLCEHETFDKPTFGSVALGQYLKAYDTYEEKISSVTLIGLCTDICVISNAMLIKAFLPEVRIFVDAACCAGVTPESHERALDAMSVCQIKALNR